MQYQKIPSQTVALGLDFDGGPFSDNWEYTSIMGILMFLAINYRPVIAYIVHQCSRFYHFSKASHGSSAKRIIR